MKGLMIKDMIAITNNGRTLLFIVLVFAAMSLMSGSVTVMSSALSAVIAVLGINTFSYDEICHWEEYSAALPVKRSRVVLARYLVFVATCLLGFGVSVLMSSVVLFVTHGGSHLLVNEMGEAAVSSLSSMTAIMVMFSVMIPLIYKYGVQKMRILSMMFIVVPLGVGFVLESFSLPMPSVETLANILKMLPLAAVVCIAISYFVSVRIFEKKQF